MVFISIFIFVAIACGVGYSAYKANKRNKQLLRQHIVRTALTPPLARPGGGTHNVEEILKMIENTTEKHEPTPDDPCSECGAMYEMTDDYLCPKCRKKMNKGKL